MRALCAAFVFAFLTSINITAADWPIVIRAGGTNLIRLPSRSSDIWIDDRRGQSIVIPLKEAAKEKFEFQAPRMSPGLLPEIAACRVKINGKWQQIHETVIDFAEVEMWDDIRTGAPKNWRQRTVFFGWIGDLTGGAKKVALGKLPPKTFRCEIVANRLGSQLDPVIRLLDNLGREVAYSDDDLFAGRDGRIQFDVPRAGEYFLEIRDIAYNSGADFFYYLRAASDFFEIDTGSRFAWVDRTGHYADRESKDGNDTSETAERISPPCARNEEFNHRQDQDWFFFDGIQSKRVIIRAETRQIGSPCDAALGLFDPKGKLVSESVGAGVEGPSITNSIAAAGEYRIRVREITGGSVGFPYRLTVKEASPGVELSTEIERVDFAKEGEAKIKIDCKRYDYDGVVKLTVEGVPEGVKVVEATIPEKKNEGTLKLKRERDVPAFQIRIKGKIDEAKNPETFEVSTMPALRKLYPLQLFPCAAMDGWIAVNPPGD